MKRNNALVFVLFGLSLVLPLFDLTLFFFFDAYSVMFYGEEYFVILLSVTFIGVCIALLCMRDKRIGQRTELLLLLTMFLTPSVRFLCAGLSDSLPFLVLLSLWTASAAVVVGFYARRRALRIFAYVLTALFSAYATAAVLLIGTFLPSEILMTDVITSPDGDRALIVAEFSDPDNAERIYTGVEVYKLSESFSVGPLEFRAHDHTLEKEGSNLKVEWVSDVKFHFGGQNYYVVDRKGEEKW